MITIQESNGKAPPSPRRERRKAASHLNDENHLEKTPSSTPNIRQSTSNISPAQLQFNLTQSLNVTQHQSIDPLRNNGNKVALNVSKWIYTLDIPFELKDKYIKLFKDEEIFHIEQIKKLTEKHLRWMGVKVGTILVMMESINKLQVTTVSELEDMSFFIQSTKSSKLESNSPRVSQNELSHSDFINYSSEDDAKIHQAGGHGGVISRVRPGFIRKITDFAECNFYQQLQDTKKIPEVYKSFFPKLENYAETSPALFGLKKQLAVVMEDLTFGYSKPCIMDIKMGTKTYAEDSNPVKKKFRQMKDDGTTSSRYGLRVTGYRTYNTKISQFYECSKENAERINTIDSLEKNIQIFFENGNELRLDVVKYLVERLTILLCWMEVQTVYRFYSSSLLFVYDGGITDCIKADVRMIDFAHVSEIKDNGVDEGYVKGLRKLIGILKNLLKM